MIELILADIVYLALVVIIAGAAGVDDMGRRG